jgi:aspartate kinase
MIVMKFGGTSVESAAAIERVAAIVQARRDRKPVVVVSAMGKTTNKLLAIAQTAIDGTREQYLRQIHDLRDFHSREARLVVPLAERSELDRTLDEHFQELTELVKGLAVLGELTPRSIDAISSYGERLSSLIVTLAFRHFGMSAAHVDSRRVIVTDRRHTQAAPQFAETYRRLSETIPALAETQVVVMGGFIGSTTEGVTTTLGRGGSDFTASIVGAGVGAEEIQIWTDVDGMLTADPTILGGGHRVRTISFAEAAELAYFGAKVLHPATVLPAIEKNIPVLILNSRRPEVDGTRITGHEVHCSNVVKSIACKRKITLVNVHSTRMLMAHGFLHRIFEVFDRMETPVDMVSTSEVSVSLTIDNPRNLDAICAELRGFAEVTREKDQAIVCLVGENIRYTPGVAARVFDSLGDVNVRMISQGASLLNLSIVVAEADLLKAVERLHGAFFAELDPNVFERNGKAHA